MELYKTIQQYSDCKWIHLQSWINRKETWVLLRVTVWEKKVWYLDIYETNLILAQLIKK